MPHIHTQPGQHDQTASALIFRCDEDEPRVLLHMHKKLGRYMQPGGHVELHETPWQAIMHELEEETGYLPEQLTVLQPDFAIFHLSEAVIHPVAFAANTHGFPGIDHRHTDTLYLLEVSADPQSKPADGESTDFLWATASDIEMMKSDQTRVNFNIVELALAAFDVIKHWQRVPVNRFER